jgi:hypothetical protein
MTPCPLSPPRARPRATTPRNSSGSRRPRTDTVTQARAADTHTLHTAAADTRTEEKSATATEGLKGAMERAALWPREVGMNEFLIHHKLAHVMIQVDLSPSNLHNGRDWNRP